MNRQPYTVPPRRWQTRLNPVVMRLTRPWRRLTLRHRQKFVRVNVEGHEHLREARRNGAGILITPNHSFHYDSFLLAEVGDRLRCPFHFMTSWQVFAMVRPLEQWLLQRHGCFSVDRESHDTAAFRQTVDLLRQGRNPVVVFAEGDIYHNNDTVMPFREGAAAMAMAAARKRERPVKCVPCGLRVRYLDDPTKRLHRTLDGINLRYGWTSKPQAPVAERLKRLGGRVLALQERQHLGRIQSGTPSERIEALIAHLLVRMEQRYGIRESDRDVPNRMNELRRRMIAMPVATFPDAVMSLQHDLDQVFVVGQLYSYQGLNWDDAFSPERLSEITDKLEEDLLDAAVPGVRGRRMVTVRFGEPVDVDSGWKGSAAVQELTALLQSRVQTLLDDLGTETVVPVRRRRRRGAWIHVAEA